MKEIKITAMLDDSGCKLFEIPVEFLGPLSTSIMKNGSETIHTAVGNYVVVGFMITGKKTGERVIVLGSKEDSKSHEQ